MVDPEHIVKHLDDGREAVRRARGAGDDGVGVWVELVVVDPDHAGQVFALGRRRDDDLLRPGPEVGERLFFGAEPSGALKDQFDAQLGPR